MIRVALDSIFPLQKCWRCQLMGSKEPTVTHLATLELPPSKHRWVSAILALSDSTFSDDAAPHSHTLILGDRKGSLHVYKTRLDPSQDTTPSIPTSSYRVHGPNGVSCVRMCGGCVCSAGRDGYCRRYRLDSGGSLTQLSQFKVSHILKPSHSLCSQCSRSCSSLIACEGMDWIEDVYFLKDDTLMLGFHTVSVT